MSIYYFKGTLQSGTPDSGTCVYSLFGLGFLTVIVNTLVPLM